MSEFNYKKYWIKRHEKIKDYSSVGIKSIGNRANELSYDILLKRYKEVLGRLNIKKGARFLDAGSGIGILSNFLAKNNAYPLSSYKARFDFLLKLKPEQ